LQHISDYIILEQVVSLHHTFSIVLPLRSVSHVETIVFHILQDNIVKIHEDLANLQNQLSDEGMTNPAIPIVENLNRMIEDMDGIEFLRNIFQIFEKLLPTTSGALPLNTIQGEISIPPPTIVAYIPTYMNSKVTTTIQPTSSVIPSLRVSTSISNPFVVFHIIFPTTSLPTRIPFTCPSYTYTLPPYSPTSQNTNNDPLINHLMQMVTSL
jgi:hypothetical protein